MINSCTQSIKPSFDTSPTDLFNLAASYMTQRRYSDAAQIYRSLLQASPDSYGCWLNLGTALRCLGHVEAAAACAKRALSIKPDQSSALTNYGNCLVDLDRIEESMCIHARAVAINPQDFFTQKNYAIALREFGQYEQAIKHFDTALSIKPDDISTQWERAITYLHLGRFEEGWKAFEIRWETGKLNKRICTFPRWNGEPLQGKTILVYEEQGFGDSILCSRYLPLIAKQGGKIVLECKPPLHRLFKGLPSVIQITELGKFRGHSDYHIPMMSLPGVFGTDFNSIPPAPDLAPAPDISGSTKHLMNLGTSKLKVGIVWSGSTTFSNNKKRAVTVDRFLQFAEIPGVQLYSLQKGPCEKDLLQCGAEGLIYDLARDLEDFATTAAILEKLDLVIMTDSSVAHLAGSLGRPVWNILGSRPYWLYSNERDTTPWYPSMRLFRQSTPGNWDGVFKEVYIELAKLAKPYPQASNYWGPAIPL